MLVFLFHTETTDTDWPSMKTCVGPVYSMILANSFVASAAGAVALGAASAGVCESASHFKTLHVPRCTCS